MARDKEMAASQAFRSESQSKRAAVYDVNVRPSASLTSLYWVADQELALSYHNGDVYLYIYIYVCMYVCMYIWPWLAGRGAHERFMACG